MITPDELDDILEVLCERSVATFSCPEFSVTLHLAAPKGEDNDISTAIKEGNEAALGRTSNPRGVFAHRSLWPDGRAPTFPGTKEQA